MLDRFVHNVEQRYTVVIGEEDGITPYTKVGKLSGEKTWILNGIEYLEGPFGEPQYDRCAHCGKTIRYVVNLTTPDLEPEAKVGPDCAITLLKHAEDIKSVQDVVGNYQKKHKFIANITTFLKKEASDTKDHNSFLVLLEKATKNAQFKNLWGSWEQVTYQSLALGKNTAKRLASFAQAADAQAVFKTFSTRMLLRSVLEKNSTALRECLEKVFLELKLTARDKKYFFDPKERFGPISEFLSDYRDALLFGDVGTKNLTDGTWLSAPPAD